MNNTVTHKHSYTIQCPSIILYNINPVIKIIYVMLFMHFLFINAATVYSSPLVRTVQSINMARQPKSII